MIPVELVVVFFLVLPLAAILFVIAGALEEKFKRKQSEKERAEIERVFNENRRALIGASHKTALKPIVRGYDSSELFRQDSLIRIRKFEAESAAEAEKKIRATRCDCSGHMDSTQSSDQWKRKTKSAPFCRFAFNPNLTAMGFDNHLTNDKTKTRSFVTRVFYIATLSVLLKNLT